MGYLWEDTLRVYCISLLYPNFEIKNQTQNNLDGAASLNFFLQVVNTVNRTSTLHKIIIYTVPNTNTFFVVDQSANNPNKGHIS